MKTYSTCSNHIHNALEYINQKDHFVYGWSRNNVDFLYIGATHTGKSRIVRHDIIGVVEPVLLEDTIHIWVVPPADVDACERFLIQFFKPKYNKEHVVPRAKPRFGTKSVVKRSKRGKLTYNVTCVNCFVAFCTENPEAVKCWECRSKELRVNARLALLPKETPKFKTVPLPRP